jgi:hypothetical protein
VATGLALFALKTQIAETQSVEVTDSTSGKFSAWIRKIRDNFGSIF